MYTVTTRDFVLKKGDIKMLAFFLCWMGAAFIIGLLTGGWNENAVLHVVSRWGAIWGAVVAIQSGRRAFFPATEKATDASTNKADNGPFNFFWMVFGIICFVSCMIIIFLK